MYFFQYWDRPPVPPDLASWIDGYRQANPDLHHVLLDWDGARRLIAEHFTDRELLAFDRCGPPAMQADYLRLCMIYACGGIYVDADHTPGEPLGGLLSLAGEGLLAQWTTILNNTPVYCRRPGNRFLRACLDLATDNILAKRFEDVLVSTGPGIFNAVWCCIDEAARDAIARTIGPSWEASGWSRLLDVAKALVHPSDEVTRDFSAFHRLPTDECTRWFGLTSPDYKQGDRHWINWRCSIYSPQP